jgi:hypothetical protein
VSKCGKGAFTREFGALGAPLREAAARRRLERMASQRFDSALTNLADARWKIVQSTGPGAPESLEFATLLDMSGQQSASFARLKIFVSAVRFCPCPPDSLHRTNASRCRC